MAKFEGFKRIIKEDFDPEDQNLIDKLAFPINSAMEFLARAVNKDITFSDNINCQIKEIDITVDSAGVPKQPTSFKSELKTASRGFIVIDVQSLDNQLSGVITGISTDGLTVVTCRNHKLNTGDEITIANTDSVPIIDGRWKVFKINSNSFSIPAKVSAIGSAGAFVRPNYPVSLPFIDFSEESKQISITRVSGLQPNIKYRLTFISIG